MPDLAIKVEEDILAIDRLDSKTQNVLGEMWQEACEKGGSLSFKIVSGSMRPVLEVGNLVKVTKVEPSEIRIGDILAFKDSHNVVIIHRVIGKTRSNQQFGFRHRGDAGGLSGKIAVPDIIGRVTVIDKAGHRVHLGSRRHIIASRILGFRLLIVDIICRMQSRPLGAVLHQTLRPIWKLCRSLLYRLILKEEP